MKIKYLLYIKSITCLYNISIMRGIFGEFIILNYYIILCIDDHHTNIK